MSRSEWLVVVSEPDDSPYFISRLLATPSEMVKVKAELQALAGSQDKIEVTRLSETVHTPEQMIRDFKEAFQ